MISMVVGAFFLQGYEGPKNRYHQHLEAKTKEVCTDHGDDVFCTHLPLLNITTDEEIPEPYHYDENGHSIKNNDTVAATIQYYDSENGKNHLKDSPIFTESSQFRIRGNASRNYDKKNYLINFTEDDLTTSKKVAFKNLAPDNSWALHGPFLDKTLIRNYLCYNLAGEMMEYSPNVFFCEMFLNGEYQGVYLITEKITRNNEGRIHLTKSDPNMNETSFIIKIDRGYMDEAFNIHPFGMNTGYLYEPGIYAQPEIVYPSSTLTIEQKQYIENEISKFEKTLTSFDFNHKKYGYSSYIDVDSFVNYFLLNEFTLNYDALKYSTYLYKDLKGKIKMVPWDFNNSFDNYRESLTTPQTFSLQNKLWYYYLFKDENFTDKVVYRYYQLRKKCLNEEYLMRYIDDTVQYLGPAIQRNYEKWGYSFQSEQDYLVPKARNVRNYDQSIEQLKDCIHLRLEYMDQNINQLYSYSHASANKKYKLESGGK